MMGTASKHLREMFGSALIELKARQDGPPGTIPRTEREKTNLWKKLNSLERPELEAMMTQMAERAGHEQGEKKMCELCRFLSDRLEKM